MTVHVSADTDDLDRFVEHGRGLQFPLLDIWETLVRQRSYLLSLGLPTVVEHSEAAMLHHTIGFMADLDRFVEEISTALKQHGNDLNLGRFRPAASTIDSQLASANRQRLDAVEVALAKALESEGLSGAHAEQIRLELEDILGYDARFQIDGATVAEPRRLAAAIVANIQQRAADLIEDNHVGSSSMHGSSILSTDRLAADLYYGHHATEFVPAGALHDALRGRLSEAAYEKLLSRLTELGRWEQRANVSLVIDATGEVEVDGGTEELNRTARALFEQNRSGPGLYGTPSRLDEPEIAYQLQQIAMADPGRALGIKLMLNQFLGPHERAEVDRILATGGSFSQRVGLAVAHPRDGVSGALKGAYNNNFGWWADLWADSQVAIANGFYGMATNSTGSEYGARVPETWEGSGSIVELEFEMANVAQQGGADLGFAVELVSTMYGGGKAGLSLVRIGQRFFLRSGDDLVASVAPKLARQLEESSEMVTVARRSADPPEVVVGPAAPLPHLDDTIVIPKRDYEPVLAPGRPGHAIDGNINGLGRASGGHYIRSPNLRVLRVIDVAPNGVIKSEIAIRGSDGRWVTKVDFTGRPAANTLFPRHWTRRRTVIEIDTAFKKSVPDFTEAASPRRPPPTSPMYWVGRASDGTVIRGRYITPGEPSWGWDSAYPIFERR